MKNLKRVLPVLGVILWAVLLLPFFLGAPAAHPATDDFTFAVYTHPTWIQTGSILHVLKDALTYALRTWRDWQGTVTGVIIMTLNPAVFSIDGYGWHAVILLALCLLADRYHVDLPICRAVYAVLYDGAQPKEQMGQLFTRSLKREFDN